MTQTLGACQVMPLELTIYLQIIISINNIISINFLVKLLLAMNSSHPILFPKLPFSEQILIWSARKWAQDDGRGSSLFETLRVAFRLARAPNAYLSLDAFMTLLYSSSIEVIDFNPPESVNVTIDEIRLSTLITTLQLDEDEEEAFLLLGHWLPPTAQRYGLVHCNNLAQELLVAGHFFSRREHQANPVIVECGNRSASHTILLENETK